MQFSLAIAVESPLPPSPKNDASANIRWRRIPLASAASCIRRLENGDFPGYLYRVTAKTRCLLPGLLFLLAASQGRPDAMLQLFNLSWEEVTRKLPEIAEAGYTSVWLPPPTKGSSGYSVGYDLFDPFDLGDKNQRGTIRTRYGTKEELVRMVEMAHRFGLRVYFDNIMNHRAFDVPGYNAFSPTNLYPGLLPQDFHLRTIEGGFYRNVDNVRDWNSAWQVQNLSLGGLLDIAHENPNANFGPYEGATAPKLVFVRHPQNPEYYDYHPTLGRVGFGNVSQAVLTANPQFYKEDVNAYLIRAVRYLLDTTRCDGFRLDAVKHVPSYFFGQQSGAGRDQSSAGYCGGIQMQFNFTHGFSDANHRDSNFDTEIPRDDALLFGEHLGEPPSYNEYVDAGMRLLDNPLRNHLNNVLGNPSASLAGLEQRDFGGFSAAIRVMHAQSHDNAWATHRELQNALYFFREGIPCIYTDGYNQSPDCANCGGPFPRHAYAPFLGQFGDPKMPDLAWLHGQLARGGTRPRWGDADIVAFERYDYREGSSSSPADQTVVLFAMNDNYGYPGDISFDDGVAQTTAGTYYECFPVENSRGQGLVVGFPPGSVLAQLADSPGADRACSKLLVRLATNDRQEADATKNDPNPVNRKVYVGNQALAPGGGAIEFKIPGGGYVAYAYQWPEPSRAAPEGVVVLRQGGQPAPRMIVQRTDGRNGDSGFNPRYPFQRRGSITPYGSVVTGSNIAPYTYSIDVPVVTNGPLDILTRLDASAVNVLIKLDGGTDINSHIGLGPLSGTDRRDNRPGTATDVFLGYEQALFKSRTGPEKFAARNVSRNTVVSLGAETYHLTIGGGSTVVNGAGGGADVDTETADWVYHDPSAAVEGGPATQRTPLDPAAATPFQIWVKVGYQYQINAGFLYYTVDGSNPEGAFGQGWGTTLTLPLTFDHTTPESGTGRNFDWWRVTVPGQPANTLVKYKIALHKSGISPISDASADKVYGLTQFIITNFNPQTATVWLHNNLNPAHTRAGLEEGFHIIRVRSFLPRNGKSSVYNTHFQTFYYDAALPQGVVAYPAQDGETLRSREYGIVIRADTATTEVEINIQDADPNNDDTATGFNHGNGLANGQPVFAKATQVSPNPALNAQYPNLPLEFRLNYPAVPASGPALITARLKKATSALLTNRFTTLTRSINAAAPEQTLSIAFPSQDGETINLDAVTPYTIVARFTETLTANSNFFTIYLDGAAQPRMRQDGAALYRFDDWTPNDGKNELRFDWSGISPGQHSIEVVYNDGALNLQASRFVNFNLIGPDTSFIAPPLTDARGQPFVLVLPAIANPTPSDRSYLIVVETPQAVTNVIISFLPANAGFVGGPASPDTNFVGQAKRWQFLWTNIVEGVFTIRADAFAAGTDTATRQLAVRFLPPDSDQDGLPDEWENQFLLNPFSATGDDGASGDPDGDGFSNLEEYLAGTNPQDAASLLKITATSAGGRQITWQSIPGKVYQVLATSDVLQPMSPIATNVMAAGASTTFTDNTPGAARKFYRVTLAP